MWKFALNAGNLNIVLFWYSQYKLILPLLQLLVTDSLGQNNEWLWEIFERNCIFVANGHIKMVFLNYKKPCQIVQWVFVAIIFKIAIVYLLKDFFMISNFTYHLYNNFMKPMSIHWIQVIIKRGNKDWCDIVYVTLIERELGPSC